MGDRTRTPVSLYNNAHPRLLRRTINHIFASQSLRKPDWLVEISSKEKRIFFGKRSTNLKATVDSPSCQLLHMRHSSEIHRIGDRYIIRTEWSSDRGVRLLTGQSKRSKFSSRCCGAKDCWTRILKAAAFLVLYFNIRKLPPASTPRCEHLWPVNIF